MDSYTFPADDSVVFTSDSHLGHHNIIEYCNRPFKTVHEMDRIIWSFLKDADAQGKTIIHCGDIMLKVIPSYVFQHPERHILIRGNHDYNNNVKAHYHCLFGTIIGVQKKWPVNSLIIRMGNTPVLISHAPQDDFQNCALNIHGHIHNHGNRPNPKYKNVSVEMTNYRPVTWNDVQAL